MRRQGMPSRGALKIRWSRIYKLPEFMTRYKATQMLGIHPTTMEEWLASGELPFNRIGNKSNSPLSIRRDDLIGFLQRTGRVSSVDPFETPARALTVRPE